MNRLENDFFEEYKKLDSLCKDVLNSGQGVTDYIREMDKTSLSERRLATSWDNDYRMLKRVRWVRSNLAHESGPSECQQEDLDFVIKFYKRIISRTDPFGMILLEKKQREINRVEEKQKIITISVADNQAINNLDGIKWDSPETQKSSDEHVDSNWIGVTIAVTAVICSILIISLIILAIVLTRYAW